MDKVMQADRIALYRRLGLGEAGLVGRPFTARLDPAHPAAPAAEGERVPRVLLHSLQGGVGSSTLAVGLACQFARAGLQSRLLDLGRQNQVSFYFQEIEALPDAEAAWLDGRRFGRRLGVMCPPAGREIDLDEQARQCMDLFGDPSDRSFLVADLPAAGHARWPALLGQVDLAVLPLRPDLFALQAADRLLRAVEAAGAPALFVLNGFDPGQRAHRSVRQALAEMLGPRLLDPCLPHDTGLADRHMACEPLEADLYRSPGFQALYARCALAAMRRLAHS